MTKITWDEKGNRRVDGCECVVKNREEGESEREWFKRWMCMYHWMQTDYYQTKLESKCSRCGQPEQHPFHAPRGIFGREMETHEFTSC